MLLTRTLYLKQSEIKNFVIVDAAMNDLIRPAFYDSYHAIWPVKKREGESYVADVVGPICETGDFLALGRPLPEVDQGDVVAILGAGAYGFVMGSTYNARPRPPEVIVDSGRWAVARPRERLEDLLVGETADPFGKASIPSVRESA